VIFARLRRGFEFEAEVEFDSIGGSKWIFDLLDFERTAEAWDVVIDFVVSIFDIVAILIMHMFGKFIIGAINRRNRVIILWVTTH
jgi:hypothetical protein